MIISTHNNKHSFLIILKITSPALIIYGVFFIVRVFHFQPPTEAGMGDFITSLNLIFGASIAYMMFVLKTIDQLPLAKPTAHWWLTVSFFLLYLAFDEIFMIHEYFCYWLKIGDIYLFGLYGIFLLSLIFVIRHLMTRISFVFLGGFIVLSGIAVLADALTGEGIIVVGGTVVGYEQICESLATLSLASCFFTIAYQEISQYLCTERTTSCMVESRITVTK